ncbi:hypothetical protein Scep_011654 [Stephania cephalantha]|uniref:Myb/SANT-like DNA-binding domain-containing protein n=1 Tax=Stephania cephalantha TaxID=152367 RepID=A0AAP0JDH3_9MAGN
MEGLETLTPPATAPATRPSSVPIREDCWSEEATSTLIDAWGERHLELNRGNLRQKHWQEVADAVNARHGAIKKARRTDVQCKNRIDTLKKKYKLEKAKILASGASVTSKWPFYDRLDALIGPSSSTSTPASAKKPVPSPVTTPAAAPPLAVPLQYRKQLPMSLPHATVVPVAPRSVREKRPAAAIPVDDSFFRKNYSAVAAAAAAADSESSRSSTESRQRERYGGGSGGGGGGAGRGEVDGVRELAQAIVRFGEIYEKVEEVKQRQMVELEKQRMEFMKSLEFQRMQLFMDWQVQLEKIKRAKRATSSVTLHQVIANNLLLSLGVKGRVPFWSCPEGVR